jgi:hypothetical protein
MDAYVFALLGALGDRDRPGTANGLCELLEEFYIEHHGNPDARYSFRLERDFPDFSETRPRSKSFAQGWWGFDKESQEQRIKHISRLIDRLDRKRQGK